MLCCRAFFWSAFLALHSSLFASLLYLVLSLSIFFEKKNKQELLLSVSAVKSQHKYVCHALGDFTELNSRGMEPHTRLHY